MSKIATPEMVQDYLQRFDAGVKRRNPGEPEFHQAVQDVAESLALGNEHTVARAVLFQRVPVGRVFMTYFETDALNRQYKEREAVLVFDPANVLF